MSGVLQYVQNIVQNFLYFEVRVLVRQGLGEFFMCIKLCKVNKGLN